MTLIRQQAAMARKAYKPVNGFECRQHSLSLSLSLQVILMGQKYKRTHGSPLTKSFPSPPHRLIAM
jgi:hypothetical protein